MPNGTAHPSVAGGGSRMVPHDADWTVHLLCQPVPGQIGAPGPCDATARNARGGLHGRASQRAWRLDTGFQGPPISPLGYHAVRTGTACDVVQARRRSLPTSGSWASTPHAWSSVTRIARGRTPRRTEPGNANKARRCLMRRGAPGHSSAHRDETRACRCALHRLALRSSAANGANAGLGRVYRDRRAVLRAGL